MHLHGRPPETLSTPPTCCLSRVLCWWPATPRRGCSVTSHARPGQATSAVLQAGVTIACAAAAPAVCLPHLLSPSPCSSLFLTRCICRELHSLRPVSAAAAPNCPQLLTAAASLPTLLVPIQGASLPASCQRCCCCCSFSLGIWAATSWWSNGSARTRRGEGPAGRLAAARDKKG